MRSWCRDVREFFGAVQCGRFNGVQQYLEEGELSRVGGSEDTHHSRPFRGLLDRMHLFKSNLDLHDELSRTCVLGEP
jgi:hypothetical protein